MNRMRLLLTALLCATATAGIAATHTALTSDELKWMPAAPESGLPAGVELAVLHGNPDKPGWITVRLRSKEDVRIAPHWHPADEHVTILQGTFAFGMGDKFDESGLKEYSAGSYLAVPKQMHHFAVSKAGGVIELNAMGPFKIIYINPADDPRKAKSK